MRSATPLRRGTCVAAPKLNDDSNIGADSGTRGGHRARSEGLRRWKDRPGDRARPREVRGWRGDRANRIHPVTDTMAAARISRPRASRNAVCRSTLAGATRPEPSARWWPRWGSWRRSGRAPGRASPSPDHERAPRRPTRPPGSAPPTSRPTDVGPTGLASQRRPPRARGRGWPTPTGPPRPPRAGLRLLVHAFRLAPVGAGSMPAGSGGRPG